MAAFTNIGQPTPRLEGTEKVTGATRYTADLDLPGTLWGRCLRSPWPHARITHINASRATQVPGVHAVLTGADVKGVRYGRRLHDIPVLAEERVRFVGDKLTHYQDIPRLDTVILESDSGPGPYNARGIGENPCGCIAPAIANAVADASGARVTNLPITAEKVFRKLRSK